MNQLWLSLGDTQMKDRIPHPGSILVDINTLDSTKTSLQKMGYRLSFGKRTSDPIMPFTSIQNMASYGAKVEITGKIMALAGELMVRKIENHLLYFASHCISHKT